MSFAFKYNYPQVARDSGFHLRNYKDGPLDWRLIGTVEIERVVRDQCLEQIDSVLGHLAEAPLGSILENKVLDGGIAKYFILSQFSIQYLLFCRKFLEETVEELRESHGAAQMEVASLKRALSEANNEIIQLHKKITQMEAIHEVIYPCSLCTKNFVSNDALNLHITRKHAVSMKSEGNETPSAKDKGNDLTLINTIKLELEIKHLKERLNNAEMKIKDGLKATTTPPATNRDDGKQTGKSSPMVSVGIQSNLTEVKEQDDQTEKLATHECQHASQIVDLQDKLEDLHQWKEEQKIQNSTFLDEINKLFNNVMESTQDLRQRKLESEIMTPSQSMEHLDALLSKKVEEIGESTVARLSDVVSRLESSYTHKLEELQSTLAKSSNQKVPSTNPSTAKTTPGNLMPELKATEKSIQEVKPVEEVKTLPQVKAVPEVKTVQEAKDSKPTKKDVKSIKQTEPTSTDSSSEEESSLVSNHTFVKPKTTDMEKSFGHTTDASEDSFELDTKPKHSKEIESHHKRMEKSQTTKSPIKPKPVTRNGSRKLVNSRLAELGISLKSTHLSHTSKKLISNELSERRHKLKEKHPNFYITRNKIKKFVDKLCSSKLPDNAQALLKATRPTNKQELAAKHLEGSSSEEEEPLMSDRRYKTSTSTPDSHAMHNKQFKQRLESILASPIRKPDEHTRVIIHAAESERSGQKYPIPIPMPRTKKVMFNQPDKKTNDIFSASESESENNFK
ncbi:cilium assembly protein DZIP1L [Stomoxys calcitrans]|uniref:C2H2-type domain-containing protein n=1 Tax=Stomoxys calcitrans TaxID=35570 RepID=A0A1I8NNW3_STOCA|nr:cilium assembly protein DZIP1L [Stomoxys calcitrans]